MKHLLLGLALAFGLLLAAPDAQVAADSDSADSDSGPSTVRTRAPEIDPALGGSAMVVLLGGVAYLTSRRRKND